MAYLKKVSIPYSSYYHWKRKYSDEPPKPGSVAVMAPISVLNPPATGSIPREGISVSTPEGMLVYFSPGMEEAAMRFLLGKGGCHV